MIIEFRLYEGTNNYHFFYNFNCSYSLKEIDSILEELEHHNVDYKIFEIDNNNFMFYFITSSHYLYNYYARRINYEISDKELPNYNIINKEDLELKLKANKFNI